MTIYGLFRKPSAFLPIAMSLASLALVVSYVATSGVARQADEGAAAHLWQLLMAGQLPLIAYFAIRWVPLAPNPGLIVLGTQVVVALAAAAPLFVLGF
jgi:hypothetical protein